MRVFIKYQSDKDGQTVTEEVATPFIPEARADDKVLAEGRPRQVSKREFFLLGEGHAGSWDNTYPVTDGEQFVVVHLIG